ncbi:hypothetical protein J2W42_003533 [Rhizobium tibeticum]|uniref:hypothetical protein n=1 Tax=Rhizobium tibeticum TaxID=501024 RepID=UPI002781DC47|nr:hypothetical protein [Rhizobium tibeticum]MDP9810670.1 hypothetical protein [Rhizobium tibeticum]
MRKILVNEDYLDMGTPAGSSVLLKGVVFDNTSTSQWVHPPLRDFSFIKYALKTLCRESGIVRDRKATVEVAALLMALVKEGVHCEAELVDRARQRWSAAKVH